MSHSLRLRLFVFCLMVSGVVICFFGVARLADAADNSSVGCSVYQADPRHLWNRLHEALFVRVGPDGRAYGQDRIDPLLWPFSKHLLEERSRNHTG